MTTRPVLFEPAEAVAAARCMDARVLPTTKRTERTHPRPCGWCDYQLGELRQLVEGFNEWAEYSNRSHTFGRHELRVWSELSRDEQEVRIVAAQAFPEPAAPTEPELAERPATGWHHEALATSDVDGARALDEDEEGPAWLR